MTYVELDDKGRLVLPKSVREAVSSLKFDVTIENRNRVVLVPVLTPKELFGAFKTGAVRIENFHDLEKTHFS